MLKDLQKSDAYAWGKDDIYSTTETDCWQAEQRNGAKADWGGGCFFFNPVWKLTPLSQILLETVCDTESKALLHYSFGSLLEMNI